MIGVAIQNVEYIEAEGPILMDVFWAVVDLSIVPRRDLINAVGLVPNVEVAGLQEVVYIMFGQSVVEKREVGHHGNQRGSARFENTA